MRARTLTATATLGLVLAAGVTGSAGAAPAIGAGPVTEAAATVAGARTGAQRFEVYSTNFEASYAPVYFTGLINTVGTGFKHFAEAQDQVYMPDAGGTLIIYHPGLTQNEGVTVVFDPTSCITHIFGSGPVRFIEGTGTLRRVRGTGTVNLDIRVFQRKNADGSCNSTDPPIGYIEIATGNLTVSLG
jgi:hypothetical protein